MSRYVTSNGKDKFVYGFDNPLSQYFLDKNGRAVVGPLSKTYGAASELYAALKKEKLTDKIPAQHLDAILGDLPF